MNLTKPDNAKKRLGITLGDPAGVGPEVLIAALRSMNDIDFVPVIVGHPEVINKFDSGFLKEFNVKINRFNEFTADNLSDDQWQIVYGEDIKHVPEPGLGNLDSARLSLDYINLSLELWKNGLIDAIVTGPVNKGLIEKNGVPFMGHTEYMAEYIGEENPFMMMFSRKYRVLLVTTHYPISKLPDLVNYKNILDTIRTGDKALTAIDGEQPLIAVCGLDPHCGDDGAIGDFDKTVTAKVVAAAKGEGMNVVGPLAADTLFMPAKWEKYSLIIAQYHDQGLIPFKMLAFEDGVNVTLGLSLVRTSVDHGTAYDIAGKGIAQSGSMEEALKLALSLVQNNPS